MVENLLCQCQCAIPVFDGLFLEPHNTSVMELLFTMAHWHGLAKLHMHHNLLLNLLDNETKAFGTRLRKFSQRTYAAFDTKELKREYNVCIHREAKQAEQANHQPGTPINAQRFTNPSPFGGQRVELASVEQPHPSETPTITSTGMVATEGPHDEEHMNATGTLPPAALRVKISGRRRKTLNINTYKFHSYGDYARTIRMHGTMDSYSTEPVSIRLTMTPDALRKLILIQGELEHRLPKSRYTRTDRKTFVKQLTVIEHRQARIWRIHAMNKLGGTSSNDHEDTSTMSLEGHHFIGKLQNFPVSIPAFLCNNEGNPAIKVRTNKLHLLLVVIAQ